MTSAVHLDPRTYPGTYKLIGGAAALDFANLVSYRGTEREHDWLDPASNARRWAEAAGLPTTPGATAAELCTLRELLARVFLAVVDGRTPGAADVGQLGRLATGEPRRLRFPAGAVAAAWIDERPSLLGRVAADAAALLTSADRLGRLGACAECRWLFLDTTRNGSRRWCDPADCGNRARQRRHYQRGRGEV